MEYKNHEINDKNKKFVNNLEKSSVSNLSILKHWIGPQIKVVFKSERVKFTLPYLLFALKGVQPNKRHRRFDAT